MRFLTLCAALAVLAAPAAAQTTFTVNSTADDSNARDKNVGDGVCEDAFTNANPSADPRCTLRAAIDEANATSGDVIINLPGQLVGGASGTYTLSRVAPNMASNTYEDANAYGDLDLGGAFSSLTIRGTATPGPQVTIGPNDRVFHLLSGDITIERVTITGGTAQPGDNGVSSPGAGEMVDGANGADGGCVLVASGVTALFDQLSVNNCATSSGGNGAAPASSIARTKGGNAGNGGNGGGIANFGTLTLRKSFVAQNGTGDAGSAGNGTSGDGSPVAGGDGGNGGNGGGVFNAGTLTVEQSTVVNNSGGDPSAGAAGTNGGARGADGEGGAGGLASLDGGTADLANSLVASNTSGDDVNNDGTTTSATKQPGSDLFDGTPADDDANVTVTFTPGTITDGGYNLIGTNNSVEAAFPAGEPNAASSIVGTGQGADPTRIDPLITGSNRSETYAVTAFEVGAGSPAINAADPAIGSSSVTIDGRGFRRPGTASGDTRADIGAFEFDSIPVMGTLVLNELDSVTSPASEEDAAEFIEIRNTSDTFTAQLADYALVFYSGADDKSYAAVDLSGALAPGEIVTVGDPSSGFGQSPAFFSGAADNVRDEDGAVGLYLGGSTSYPTGSAAGQNASSRVDILVYDNGTQPSFAKRDAGTLADAFGVSRDNVASGDDDANSLQRNGNGTYAAAAPSAGGETMSGSATDVVINEVNAVPGASEFIELWDGGLGNTPLDGLTLTAVNGNGETFYGRLDLDGFSTDASGFFVVGNVAGADVAFPVGIQDGPDAVALYLGDASDFTNGTSPSAVSNTLVDVVVYATTDAIDQPLLDAFPTYPMGVSAKTQYDEAFTGSANTLSLQRLNDASLGYSLLFYTSAPTPRALNPFEVTVDKTDSVDPVAGYRMLSSPVISSGLYDSPARTPLRVDFYAENINLVLGVKAGNPASLYQQQTPRATPILFDEYRSTSGGDFADYTPAEFASDELAPGTGFFWYWYNQFNPPGSTGTSRGYDLNSADFEFAVTGLPLDDRIAQAVLGTPGLQIQREVGINGLLMVGNPYAYPYNLNGITADLSGLQTTFFVYNPDGGTYESRFADDLAPSTANSVAVWQGFFAEVDGQVGNTVTLSGPSDFVVPSLGPLDGVYLAPEAPDAPLASKTTPETRLELELSGRTDSGVDLADRAATLRFRSDATMEWDRHDGSKLTPPGTDLALIAFVGTRDAEAYRQSVFSLPAGEEATLPLAIRTTQAGDYVISAPEAFAGRVVLRDALTGAEADLAAGGYAFRSDATDWTERFTLTVNSTTTDTPEGPAAPLALNGPFPNPTTGTAQFEVRSASPEAVRLEVYNAIGQRVLVMDASLAAGESQRLSVDTSALAGGVYVVRVASGENVETRRMTVVR